MFNDVSFEVTRDVVGNVPTDETISLFPASILSATMAATARGGGR